MSDSRSAKPEDVIGLEEVAALLKVTRDQVRVMIEGGLLNPAGGPGEPPFYRDEVIALVSRTDNDSSGRDPMMLQQSPAGLLQCGHRACELHGTNDVHRDHRIDVPIVPVRRRAQKGARCWFARTRGLTREGNPWRAALREVSPAGVRGGSSRPRRPTEFSPIQRHRLGRRAWRRSPSPESAAGAREHRQPNGGGST